MSRLWSSLSREVLGDGTFMMTLESETDCRKCSMLLFVIQNLLRLLEENLAHAEHAQKLNTVTDQVIVKSTLWHLICLATPMLVT